jgi:hypothetical protein
MGGQEIVLRKFYVVFSQCYLFYEIPSCLRLNAEGKAPFNKSSQRGVVQYTSYYANEHSWCDLTIRALPEFQQ